MMMTQISRWMPTCTPASAVWMEWGPPERSASPNGAFEVVEASDANPTGNGTPLLSTKSAALTREISFGSENVSGVHAFEGPQAH